MKAIIGLLLLGCFGVSLSAEAKVTADLAKATSKKVLFVAIGKPSALKIEGVGEDLSGKLTKDGDAFGGEAILNLSTIDTGVNLRNNHMRDKYLEVGKYPNATLKIRKLPWGADDGKDFAAKEGPFEGDLTLHGVTRPVTGTASVARAGNKITTHVNFKTTIPEYKIDIPSFMGVTVAESVDVTVDAEVPVE